MAIDCGLPSSRGQSAIVLPWLCSLCIPPGPFCDALGAPFYVDRSFTGGNGGPAPAGYDVRGRPAIAPLFVPRPTPITPVKGTYSGEIESLDRDPGIASLELGMRFPGN